jgi:tRNA nucleotidyltransferase (CCA-adding enzyme)
MTDIIVEKNALKIISVLENAGFEAYVVGGCVRDSLMGKIPDDWDITSSATPNEMMALFRKKHMTAIPTGIEHGTVTVICGGKSIEVTSYRIDGKYSDGRHPESVLFSKKLEDDLCRRDFTINAIAFHPQKGFVDLFGGYDDLKNKIIRCVGNADERFREDYLRILRAYRFSAVLGFCIAPDVSASAEILKENIRSISAERIRTEFEKTIIRGSDNGIEVFLELFSDIVFPNTELTPSLIKYAGRNLPERLAAILLNSKNPLCALKNLKYDNKTIDIICTVLSEKNTKAETKTDIKRILNRIGQENFHVWNCLKKACLDFENQDSTIYEIRKNLFEEIITKKEPVLIKHLKITGSDIMDILGRKEGKEIGTALKSALDIVIENPEMNIKELLLEKLTTPLA